MQSRYIFFALAIWLGNLSEKAFSQETYPSGRPIASIFADYRHQVNGEESIRAFEITRVFLGYSYIIDSHLSAQIILDISDPFYFENISPKRYANIRNAFLSYKLDKLTITAGIADGKGQVASRDFWGKRYVAKPFLVNYGYIFPADIGIVADFQLSNSIGIDAQIFNGEGYARIQSDNRFLYGAGITMKPVEGVVLRLFCDHYKGEEATKNTFASFAGIRNQKLSVGIEFNYKTDFDWVDSHDVYGASITGSLNITERFELFGRYDRALSVIPDGEFKPWNAENDGSLAVAGIQYKQSKHLKFAFNYQGWTPYLKFSTFGWDFLLLSAEFKF